MRLNPGGIIGALVCPAAMCFLFLAFLTPIANQLLFSELVVAAIIAGAIGGNWAWDRLFNRSSTVRNEDGVRRGESSRRPISVSDRDCPVCGEPVHWSRYWLRAWAWAKWRCPGCGSILGFDRKRRWLLTIAACLLCGFYATIESRYTALVAVPALFIGSVALGLIDRVTVVGNRNARYCPACRYDLTGTLAAAIDRCPECGRGIPSGRPAESPPPDQATMTPMGASEVPTATSSANAVDPDHS